MSIICPHCRTALESVPAAGSQALCPVCGSSFPFEPCLTTGWNPSESQRKVGKFELIDQVGAGAFATVYKARDTELDRIVAIKVPRAGSLGSSGGDGDRFLREARSVAQLRHPSIVSVHDIGQHEGVPFLVEDFVEGITLADLLTSDRLPPRQVAELVTTVADALQYAHDHGVVHRDVKPSNIMLERVSAGGVSGTTGDNSPLPTHYAPKLMDFGLAKRDTGEGTMTVEGQVLGTPAYMSPEQARGEGHRVDGRSDVYSLGVILYELLTGELPFNGNSRMLLHHVLHDEPKPPRKRDPRIARDLETICLKAMAKQPARRYQTAAEFAADLRRWLTGEPIRARPVGRVERALKWVKRRPAVAALIGVLILVAGAGLGIAAWLRHEKVARDRLAEEARKGDEERLRAEEEARQVKVEYYASVVSRWGALEGVGRVSPEAARERHRTYKFYRRAGQVEKVEIVNSSGTLAGLPWPIGGPAAYIEDPRAVGPVHGQCRYEYRRNDRGQITEEIASDRNGRVLWVFHFTVHGPGRSTGHFTDERGFPRPRAGSGAAYVEIAWSDEGYEKEIHYLDPHGNRRRVHDGTAGLRHELDARGLPRRITFLGADDRPAQHASGYATVRLAYDRDGNQTELAYFDVNGKPTRHSNGDHRFEMTYDARGNLSSFAFFGPDGKPILDKDGGVARVTIAYDDRGNLLGWSCFGLDGKPTVHKDGFVTTREVHDERGNTIEWACFGLDGRPMLQKYGFHKLRMAYDGRGNLTEWACFGADGRPTLHKDGYHKFTLTDDHRNNGVVWACFDRDGRPALHREGYHKTKIVRDDRGNELEWSVFGTDDKPTLNTDGFHKRVRTYDDRGNRIGEAYFAPDDRLVTGPQRVARVARTFDDSGEVTEALYYGADGQPVHLDFVRDWLVLAPIPFEPGLGGAAALAREQLPNEADLRPREGDRVSVDGKDFVWRKQRAVEFFLDFNRVVGQQSNYSVAYAVCYLVSDTEITDLTLKVGSDDQARVYLNGKRVLHQPWARPLGIDQNRVGNLTLPKGTSVLVVKVLNETGAWSTCVRFADKDGRPVPNLKILLTPP